MPDSEKPEEQQSVFSWLSFFRGSEGSQVQLNPATAVTQTDTLGTVRRLVGTVTTFAIVLAVIGGTIAGTVYFLQGGPPTNASFNLKQSLSGTVIVLDKRHNSFTLQYTSSPDSHVSSLRKPRWTVLLPPGSSFADTGSAGGNACFTVPDLSGDLSHPVTKPCANVVIPGKTLEIEYLFLTPAKDQLVAKTVIGEQ